MAEVFAILVPQSNLQESKCKNDFIENFLSFLSLLGFTAMD